MQFHPRLAAVLAALLFVALVVFHFFAIGPSFSAPTVLDTKIRQAVDVFSSGRRNYASFKRVGGAAPSIGDSQKFEKIGSLSQRTDQFDEDKDAVNALIEANSGIVQVQRAQGLKGGRVLYLGIGVPPERFDDFIETARTIGRGVAIEIVKNDKTNEYLQLKARRATLEKARKALEDLSAGGGSIDERAKLQDRLTDIEQKIQELGVSLGDFDSQNELCTVRLTLQEVAKRAPVSVSYRLVKSLAWAASVYLQMAFGFFVLVLGCWIGVVALREGVKLIAASGKS